MTPPDVPQPPVPQPGVLRFKGSWKALFICANQKIIAELTPLLRKHLPIFSDYVLKAYPTRQELAQVLSAEAPDLCLLEISEPHQIGLAVIPDLLQMNAKLPIVVVLSSNDPELVLRCLRQGASDFLIPPFTSEQLEAALHKIARLRSTPAASSAKVYCIMPAKGGCGASTVSSNVAYQMRRGDKRVLLADLDPFAGTLSFLLKMKSNYSFMDVLARSHDIDTDLWKAVVSNRHGVDVMLAPEAMTEGLSDLKDASGIVEYARGAYDVVVLDAGGAYGEWNLSQAQLADEILLVTTNELTALQAVQRSLGYLDSNNVPRHKLRLIVNHYDKHRGLSKDVIGTALHCDIFHILPNDYEAIQKSLMEGKLLPPSTAFGKGVIALADRLGGVSEPQKKNGSLSGLRSLFSRT